MNLQRSLVLTLALTLLASLSAAAANNPGILVDRLFVSYSSGDVDGMLAVYADDALFEDIAQRHRVQGSEALRDFLAGIFQIHQSMGIDEKRRVVKGNVVTVEYAYTGVLSGAALSQVTGKEDCQDTEYVIPVTSWYEVQDGRVARQTDFIDLASLAEVRERASGATQTAQ